MDHAPYLNDTHFSGIFYMRPAAGADIPARNLYDPYLAAQFLLAPVINGCKFFFGRVKRMYRHIVINNLVGRVLQPVQPVRCDHTVKIHGHFLGAHVESHIFISIKPVHQPGQDMLPRMLLHIVIALLPVNDSLRQRSRLKRGSQLMEYFLPLFMDR